MMKTSTLLRLAAVGVAVTAIAACTPRRPVDSASGDTAPPSSGPQYPTVPSGPIDGGNMGAAAPRKSVRRPDQRVAPLTMAVWALRLRAQASSFEPAAIGRSLP